LLTNKQRLVIKLQSLR